MTDLVRLEMATDAPIATVTLDQRETRNPTSIASLDAMDAALDRLPPETRALILTGAGRVFCAGLDLNEVQGTPDTVHTLLRRLSEVMRRLRRLPLPTIARVNGAAIGGGFGFMVAADFAVTHPEAKVGYPPLEMCLSPALMAPWLIRKIGPSRARSMLLTSGTISGEAAFDAGIATHLVARDELPAVADALARELSASSAYATRRMKDLLNTLDGSMDDGDLDAASLVSAEVILHEETRTRLRRLFGDRTV
jgi:methylglutaconyl-CoA hydratase